MVKKKEREKEITVRKKKGLTMVRNSNGLPFPEGSFNCKRTTYINRLLKYGDLIDQNKKSVNKGEK